MRFLIYYCTPHSFLYEVLSDLRFVSSFYLDSVSCSSLSVSLFGLINLYIAVNGISNVFYKDLCLLVVSASWEYIALLLWGFWYITLHLIRLIWSAIGPQLRLKLLSWLCFLLKFICFAIWSQQFISRRQWHKLCILQGPMLACCHSLMRIHCPLALGF